MDKKNDSTFPFEENGKGNVHERIKGLMKDSSVRKVAQRWGIPQSTLVSMLKSKSDPKLSVLDAICRHEHVSLSWLAYGEQKESVPVPPRPPVTYVEKFNIVASAGGGAYIDEEKVADVYPFCTDYLKRYRLSHADLCIIEARGDSMEPIILDGDDLIINRKEFDHHRALQGIHVLSIDGELRVKRLEFDVVRDGYRIVSDNKFYSEEFICRDDLHRIRVIGEVVLIMGKPA